MQSTRNPPSREFIDLTLDSSQDGSEADEIENPDQAETENALQTIWKARQHPSNSHEDPKAESAAEAIKLWKPRKDGQHQSTSNGTHRFHQTSNKRQKLDADRNNLESNIDSEKRLLTYNTLNRIQIAQSGAYEQSKSRSPSSLLRLKATLQQYANQASFVPDHGNPTPHVLPEEHRVRSDVFTPISRGQPVRTSTSPGERLGDGLVLEERSTHSAGISTPSALQLGLAAVQVDPGKQTSQHDRDLHNAHLLAPPSEQNPIVFPVAETRGLGDTAHDADPNRDHDLVIAIDPAPHKPSGDVNTSEGQQKSAHAENSRSKDPSSQVPPHGVQLRDEFQRKSPRDRQKVNNARHIGRSVENVKSSLPAQDNPNVSSPPVDRSSLTVERRDAFTHLDRLSALSAEQCTQALVDLVQQDLAPGKSTSIWSSAEDALLIHAKEVLCVAWQQLWERFFLHRGNSWHTSQTRYSQKLTVRSRAVIGQAPPGIYTTQRCSNTPHVPVVKSIRIIGPKPAGISTTLVSKPSTAPVIDVFDEEDDSDQRHKPVQPMVEASRSPRTAMGSQLSGPYTSNVSTNMPSKPNMNHITMPYLSRERFTDERQRTAAALSSGTIRVSRRNQNQIARQPRRPDIHIQRPYLSLPERLFLKRSSGVGLWNVKEASKWDDQLLHVDFTHDEVKSLCPSILRGMNSTDMDPPMMPMNASLSHVLENADDHSLQKIARIAQSNGGICNRTIDSLYSFLRDVSLKEQNESASYQTLRLVLPSESSTTRLARLLRSRELGCNSPGRYQQLVAGKVPARLRETVEDTIGPRLSFTGTSGDVNTVAWSPSGETFAVGSAALTDDLSMQYNAPNNLLFGNLTDRLLIELPFHSIKREPPSRGINALPSMQASQDPLLFQSVSAVQFSPDGQALISTGYDNYARVWDVRGPRPECKYAFIHQAGIDVMSINTSGLFATGAKGSPTRSVSVFRYDLDVEDKSSLKVHRLCSPKARDNPGKEIHPTCLKWGNSIHSQQKYLLCGFSTSLQDYGEGETCIWDVEVAKPTAIARGGRTVFDVAWSPNIFGRFAVASSPPIGGGKMINRGTRSVVKIFDSRKLPSEAVTGSSSLTVNTWSTVELECPAHDVNDVVFNPSDEYLISTGCTDGSTYIWDLRQPNNLLHRFSHGTPVLELDHTVGRDEVDTGVRFVAWGGTRYLLYTGSSDGIVAQWDPYRSSEDAYIRQVVQLDSGVMSGAFSPDFSNLLLGEVNGSITMLGVGHEGESVRQCEQFPLQKADESALSEVYSLLDIDGPTPGEIQIEKFAIAAGRELIDSGEIQIGPFGDLPFRQAVQGPNYAGPFDRAEDADGLRLEAEQFQKRFQVSSDRRPQGIDRCAARITEEGNGDSGAWKLRIPEAFRFQSSCSTSSLGCLRCRSPTVKGGGEDLITCEVCKVTWRVDLLGYSQPSRERVKNIESAKEGGQEAGHQSSEVLLEVNQTIGHEEAMLQDIESYFHDKWDDRPKIPI